MSAADGRDDRSASGDSISSLNELYDRLGSVPFEWRERIIYQVSDHLRDWIQSVSDLYILYHFVGSSGLGCVLKLLEDKMTEVFESIDDLATILPLVEDDYSWFVLRAVYGFLEDWIQSADNLVEVLRLSVSRRYQELIIKAVESRWGDLIQSMADVHRINEVVESEGLRQIIFSAVEPRFVNWISAADDLRYFDPHLMSRSQLDRLFNLVEQHRSEWVTCASDLNQVARVMTHPRNRQRSGFTGFQPVFERPDNWINTSLDLRDILQYMNYPDRDRIFGLVQGRIGELIRSADDVCHVLEFLSPPDRVTVFNAIRGRLGELIQSADDLYVALLFMSHSQRDEVFDSAQIRLGELVLSAADLGTVFSLDNGLDDAVLYPRNLVEYPELKEFWLFKKLGSDVVSTKKLDELFPDIGLLSSFLAYLNLWQRGMVLKIYRRRLSGLINTAGELGCILSCVAGCSEIVFDAVQGRLCDLISSNADFGFLEHLNDQQREIVFAEIEDDLGSFNYNLGGLLCALKFFNSEQGRLVFDSARDQLGELAKESIGEFFYLMRYISDEQRSALLNAVKGRVKEMTLNEQCLRPILEYSNQDQLEVVFSEEYGLQRRSVGIECLSSAELAVLIKQANVQEMERSDWFGLVFDFLSEADNRENCQERFVSFFERFWRRNCMNNPTMGNSFFLNIFLQRAEFLPTDVRESVCMADIFVRLRELSNGYEGSAASVHQVKKKACDFLMVRVEKLIKELLFQRESKAPTTASEIKDYLENMDKDLKTRIAVCFGVTSRLARVIIELRQFLGCNGVHLRGLPVLSIFAAGGAAGGGAKLDPRGGTRPGNGGSGGGGA